MNERNVQGAVTFLGFLISIVAVIYFGAEFIPEISEYGQFASLSLLAVCFAFLGVFLQSTSIGGPFFDGARLRWLRPTVVLVLLSIITAFIAEIRFITIPDVPRALKVLISLAVGLSLIMLAARWQKRREGTTQADGDA